MKTQVFVLVPHDVRPAEIDDYVRLLLDPYRFDHDGPRGSGRFDYLVGALKQTFNDPVAEGRLPSEVRRAYARNICERANLPDVVPGALVTPDGTWHDVADFGWRMVNGNSRANRAAFERWSARYRELIAGHEACWVVEVWAHS